MSDRYLAPPGGMPPPTVARLPGGREVELAEPAAEITRRYGAEFPEEVERYGRNWAAWCRHDNQHILDWAAGDVAGLADLAAQLGWLHSVLSSRGYPAARLARDVAIAGEVMAERGEADIAERLAAAAAAVPR